MAELERQIISTPTTQQQFTIDSLPALIGKLGEDVMNLVDAKLGLLKVEIKEDAGFYGRNVGMIATGGVVAAIGFALVNVAIAFFISALLPEDWSNPARYGAGFIITGLLYLIIGGALAYSFINKMSQRSAVPHRSIEEIERDKQWLKNEV